MQRLGLKDLLASPANFLALGAGSGLAPKAPGTAGTVAAIPVWLLMPSSLTAYLLVTVALFAVGVWLCSVCANNLNVHDHPGIVWDEIVGYLVTMIAVPKDITLIIGGFVLFRLFDILKPWPIGWIDRRVQGGMGIMLDDIIAGLFAAAVLQTAMSLGVGPR